MESLDADPTKTYKSHVERLLEKESQYKTSSLSSGPLYARVNKETSVPNHDNAKSASHGFTSFYEPDVYKKFKASLKERFQHFHDGPQNNNQAAFLTDISTELYITEGESGEVNPQHEVRQIENLRLVQQLAEDIPTNCNDIFKPLPEPDKPIRTVLTQGVAGIGKTVSVQKFILDWAEGKANQDIHFIFPLPFRELNLIINQQFSLETLVLHFFPQLKKMNFANIAAHNVAFIIDGMDEQRLPLDFQNSLRESDVTRPASVDVLLTNLINGCLLPSALIWITSRPAAASQIPSACVSRLTEIRGFNDLQKEEYITKKVTDQIMANKIISHLKLSRSLYIMCHIPVCCWISTTVLEQMLQDSEEVELPKTLTGMYTHFLIIQTRISNRKYDTAPVDKEMIIKLGQLAFKQLLNGNLIFYEEDLTECGISVNDAAVYSGVCTQIFREERELHSRGKVFCFVHLSIQEHLAALYVHLTFREGNKTVLNQWKTSKKNITFQGQSIVDLHKSAIDKALKWQNGQFDLFLRFLLGLSQDSNQSLLQELLPQTSEHTPQNTTGTIEYIKIRLKMNLSPEKYINLFHCLNELGDCSLEQEIQSLQKNRNISKTKLSTSQWSALVFVLLSSGSALDVFDLKNYSRDNADECLRRMLPVAMASRTAEIRDCKLLDKGFQTLAAAITSKSTRLRELRLSSNSFDLSGIKILFGAFTSPQCKLETLEFSDCKFSKLASEGAQKNEPVITLPSNASQLRELELSLDPQDLVLKMLTNVLQDPKCKLEKIKLVSCQLSSQSGRNLASALSTNSNLTDLDLSKNALKDSGVKQLSTGLKNPCCKLKSLSLEDCGISELGCSSLCAAVKSNPSHLTELCLNKNPLKDDGVLMISDFLQSPDCKLAKLSLAYCGVSEKGCAALAWAIAMNPFHLTELDLTGNKPGSAVEKLTAIQKHKEYRLEKIRL